MKRIHWHWSAGSHSVSDTDRKHYHFIIDGDGAVHEGNHLPEANLSTKDGHYAAHTRAANTGAVGVAVAAMHGARHSPFHWGDYPITAAQLGALVQLSADLSETYSIPVKRETMLSHAEVEPTLGIKQRGKWDITVLPGMKAPTDPVTIGDELRRRVREELLRRKAKPQPERKPTPVPKSKPVKGKPSIIGAVLFLIGAAAVYLLKGG